MNRFDLAGRNRLVGIPVMAVFIFLGIAGAEVLSGGAFFLSQPFFNAGGSGTPLTGGALSLSHSIGQGAGAQMTGGTLSLEPGILGAAAAARPDLEKAHAFPTPFRPSRGHDRITFRGLTVNARIRIYTLSGRLVKTLSKSDGATQDAAWYPVADESGRSAASGVYVYVVEGDSGRKTGKLMIIR